MDHEKECCEYLAYQIRLLQDERRELLDGMHRLEDERESLEEDIDQLEDEKAMLQVGFVCFFLPLSLSDFFWMQQRITAYAIELEFSEQERRRFLHDVNRVVRSTQAILTRTQALQGMMRLSRGLHIDMNRRRRAMTEGYTEEQLVRYLMGLPVDS